MIHKIGRIIARKDSIAIEMKNPDDRRFEVSREQFNKIRLALIYSDNLKHKQSDDLKFVECE